MLRAKLITSLSLSNREMCLLKVVNGNVCILFWGKQSIVTVEKNLNKMLECIHFQIF